MASPKSEQESFATLMYKQYLEAKKKQEEEQLSGKTSQTTINVGQAYYTATPMTFTKSFTPIDSPFVKWMEEMDNPFTMKVKQHDVPSRRRILNDATHYTKTYRNILYDRIIRERAKEAQSLLLDSEISSAAEPG
jgi:hypothetical protein